MTILGSDLPVPDEVLLVPAMRWLSEHPLAAKTRAALYITNLIEKKAAGLVFNTKMRVRLIDILSERGISAGDLLEANRVTQRANQ